MMSISSMHISEPNMCRLGNIFQNSSLIGCARNLCHALDSSAQPSRHRQVSGGLALTRLTAKGRDNLRAPLGQIGSPRIASEALHDISVSNP
jgi:hypothetical protein